MFLPPLIGTRKLVGITSLLCILPMLGWFYAVQDNTTPLLGPARPGLHVRHRRRLVLRLHASTGYFFPKRLSGTALGLQGGIGNLA